MEMPRSPLRQLRMYMKYCTSTGLSRPYLASMLARMAGEGVLSPMKGVPGSRRIRKKVMVTRANRVSTA